MTTFFSPQLILQKSNGYFHKKKLSFFEVPDGIQHFPGGGGGGGGFQLFPGGGGGGGGGVQSLIPYRNNITCNFPGGGGGVRTPVPPSGSAHGKN